MLLCVEKEKCRLLIALVLAVMLLFTACESTAKRVQEQLDLGQRYLTELNYKEAVLAFTQVIEIDPKNISAYIGRAQAYKGAEQYEEAKIDYTAVIDKTDEQPYVQAEAYFSRGEVNEWLADNQAAFQDYKSALEILKTIVLEELVNVTEQMVEDLIERVYNAYIRINAFIRQNMTVVPVAATASDFDLSFFQGVDDIAIDTDEERGTSIVYIESLTDSSNTMQVGEDTLMFFPVINVDQSGSDAYGSYLLYAYYEGATKRFSGTPWPDFEEFTIQIGEKDYSFHVFEHTGRTFSDGRYSNGRVSELDSIYIDVNSMVLLQDIVENQDKEIRVDLIGKEDSIDFILTEPIKNGIVSLYDRYIMAGGVY